MFEMSTDELALVTASIIKHFGICRLDEEGHFKGAPAPEKNWDGMTYGYLVREDGGIMVVDSTPDAGDVVVDHIFA